MNVHEKGEEVMSFRAGVVLSFHQKGNVINRSDKESRKKDE